MIVQIISLNVRGIGNLIKRASIFNWCKNSSADLILLQETHSTVNVEAQWQQEYGGSILFSHGTNNSRGVAIVFRKDNDIDVTNVYNDDDGRILCINVVKEDLKFAVVNIYAPNIENLQIKFYVDLNNYFNQNNFD